MVKLKILACAYRRWAFELLEGFYHDILIVTKPKDLERKYNAFMPHIVLLLGWSWKVPEKIYKSVPTICLHPSPLPLYRGGSPLQHQIMDGKKEGAVTYFIVDDGIDSGPILAQTKLSLEGNIKDIFARMVIAGRQLLRTIIEQYPDFKTYPQEGKSTFYKRRTPEQSQLTRLDFYNKSAEELYNFIRALGDPYPNAFIICGDGRKIYFKEVSLGA